MARKYTEKRMLSNRKWDAANLDRMSIALPKGSRDKIKAHAEHMGETANQFIGRAIEEAMFIDKLVEESERREVSAPTVIKFTKIISEADLEDE